MAATIKTVGVVGTGVIGSSWVGLFLAKGLHVLVSDPGDGAEKELSNHLENIWPLLERIGLSPGASLSNYTFVGSSLAGHFEKLDFVQENVPERLNIKSQVIAEIDQGTRENVVIASSSSGIPSSQFIKDCKKNPSRILIGHPFNPPHIMPLVEVVPHPGTNEDSVQIALEFSRDMGKKPIVERHETPGFVVNRLQAAINNEMFSLVQRGVVTAKEIDICMMNSLGPSWSFIGPFMKDVLGGGPAGFEHLMKHVGLGMQGWLKDMTANSYEYTDENPKILDRSVQDMLGGVDLEKMESERNDLMIDLFKAKASASSLI
ncbi:uncharacterized protein LY89DRAFT_730720 [Mollisia scopiformis]|uniref:Uncharacterized protein n=1 Tax=Mollisia scopiformis TaxID=149040 RepID=A0A194XKL8_MOLSC|nr:uncharacterized protein LY89DRAFT_730720 [Mollisia scopiformis]KUJ20703.1 hypothetical protein LY89DRAFT_730720 [Mollisia scopiformis]